MGVALGDLWVILGSLWRHDACMLGFGAVSDLVLDRKHILKGQGRHGDSKAGSNPASRSHFVSCFVYLEHCEVNLGI